MVRPGRKTGYLKSEQDEKRKQILRLIPTDSNVSRNWIAEIAVEKGIYKGLNTCYARLGELMESGAVGIITIQKPKRKEYLLRRLE